MIEERLKFDYLEFHSSSVIGKDGKLMSSLNKSVYISTKMQQQLDKQHNLKQRNLEMDL